MSKLDAQRAMREARYAERTRPATPAPVRPVVRASRPADPPVDGSEPTAAGLCGHRAISGRTCTREHGHAAKSHRYA